MRINLYNQNNKMVNSINVDGDTINYKLTLFRHPVQNLEAASKHYVDNSLLNIDAAGFTSGILNATRIPFFVGDITKLEGSNVVTLTNNNFVPGTYRKVNVNSKGLSANGGLISESDIDSGIDWNKINVSSLPNSLVGYGIVDAISTSGGTLTGFLSLTATPTQQSHSVNKQYVDAALAAGGSGGGMAGDIVYSADSNTPSGFLKCNGALLNKTTYAALYSAIGDRYTPPFLMDIGSGKPWKQQYYINTTQSTDITGWVNSGNLPVTGNGPQAIVTKNRVYLICASSSDLSSVYTAPINADGTLGTWVTDTPLPVGLQETQFITTKNHAYILGGKNGISSSSAVYKAPINADGTLGAWTTEASLPNGLSPAQAIVTKDRIYLLGGDSGLISVGTVYTTVINTDGTLGAWVTDTSLPSGIQGFQAIVTKNRVYLLGGYSAGSVATVYTAPINTDGTLGVWTTGTSLPIALSSSQALVTNSRVYLFGGLSSSGSIADIYSAPINLDGTLGTWATNNSLPQAKAGGTMIVTNSKLYLLGGVSSSVIYSADIVGGLNDYSPYYDSVISGNNPSNNFMLPNIPQTSDFDSFAYIKY